MENNLELGGNLRDHEVLKVISSQSSQQACQRTKLGDRFKLDRDESSCADFHPKVSRNVDSVPQNSKAFRPKQRARSKADELVRYMSNLPSYLERGEDLQEKAFNVGVLEWRHLEKWQYNQSQVLQRSCKSSPSNSLASSFSSTEGSSSNSGRGHSCSPADQRMQCPSLESNINASPSRICSHGVKSLRKNGGKFQDLGASSTNYLKVSQSILSTHQCFNKYTENKTKECKIKDPDPLGISEKRESKEPEDHGVMSSSKGKMKVHNAEPLKEKEKSQVPCSSHHNDHDSMDRRQSVLVLYPKDGLKISCPATSEQSDTAGKYQDGSQEASRRCFSDKSSSDFDGLSSEIPHSCPLPREANTFRDSQEPPRSTAIKSTKFSSELLPYSEKISASPSRGRILEEKKLVKTVSSAEAPNLKMNSEEDSKVRNPSPIRRLMGRIGRQSNSKDTSCIQQSNHDTDKFCSREAKTSAYSVDSSCEKSNATGKGRSSPLRRMLDPLLKPRASNFDHPIGSLQRDSSPIDRACKLSKGRGESAARHSMKVKLDLGSCKTVEIDHPQEIENCGSSVQALLQVAVKNELPLFTFAVDNSNDILAATMRKLSSCKKDGNSWIYTFFTIHEMKKRNGSWLNQGNKDRMHGYIPNVVAQMKVSDVASRDLIKQDSVDHCGIREFVMLATNKRQGEQQASDLQSYEELAAIVLKLPKMASRNLSGRQKMGKVDKLSMVDLKERYQEVCSFSESRDVEESGSSPGIIDLFRLAVILPGGDHGLPSKGEPSPLIERWRSGGSCDCGGWDLGCRIRILASHGSWTSGSVKAQSSSEKFQLYSQEQESDRKPIFSLAPFKDGIYSVEFDSSIKLLQAFSICIAVLNGLQPANFSELGNFFEKKSSEETILT